MNRKIISAAVIAGAGLALFTSQQLRSRILPTGLITQSQPLNSALIVTPEPIPGHPLVRLTTSKGDITLELRPDLAPQTVTDFLARWNTGACDDSAFTRIEDWLIQGCNSPNSPVPPSEFSSASFSAGSIGIANSQFFIVKKDSSFLDGAYTYFGRVTSGLDVISRLAMGDKIISSAILSK